MAALQPVPRGLVDAKSPAYIENRQWLENLRNLVLSTAEAVDEIEPTDPPSIANAIPATTTNYQLSEKVNLILDVLRDAGLVAPE